VTRTVAVSGFGILSPLQPGLRDRAQWVEQLFDIDFLDPNIYYISSLPSELEWNDVTLIGLSAFLITLCATIYPAWKASRTRPAEALRYE